MRIMRWARKHDKLLTVLGAFVIVGSFLTKEVYGDRAKDLEASVSAAESEFAIHDVLSSISTRIDTIKGTVENIQERVANPKKHEPIDSSGGDWAVRAAHDHQRYVALMQILESRLAVGVKHGCEGGELARLQERIEAALGKSDNISRTIPRILADVYDCHDRLVVAADAEVTEAATRSKFQKKLSYCFFAFGWSLTLLGKLTSKDASAELHDDEVN